MKPRKRVSQGVYVTISIKTKYHAHSSKDNPICTDLILTILATNKTYLWLLGSKEVWSIWSFNATNSLYLLMRWWRVIILSLWCRLLIVFLASNGPAKLVGVHTGIRDINWKSGILYLLYTGTGLKLSWYQYTYVSMHFVSQGPGIGKRPAPPLPIDTHPPTHSSIWFGLTIQCYEKPAPHSRVQRYGTLALNMWRYRHTDYGILFKFALGPRLVCYVSSCGFIRSRYSRIAAGGFQVHPGGYRKAAGSAWSHKNPYREDFLNGPYVEGI